jgi:predicted kinase
MEAVLFSGIQAAGKSTFFKAHFVDTHIRINLDMLRTRHRERLLIAACLEAKQPFVVENTNLTVAERAGYIARARAARFRLVGYRFHVSLEEALRRNAIRIPGRTVPAKAIRGAIRRWQPPSWQEGFDALYDVWSAGGEFTVREALHENR